MQKLATVRPLGTAFEFRVPPHLVDEFAVAGHRPASTALVTTVVRGVDLVVDIGAEYGYFSLLAAEVDPDVAIVAVETPGQSAAVLRTNAGALDGSRLRVVGAGESDLGLPVVDRILIRIDVPGDQIGVLKSLREVIDRTPDVRLLVTVERETPGARDSAWALAAELDDLGFRSFLVDEPNGTWAEIRDGVALARTSDDATPRTLYALKRDRAFSVSLVLHSGGLGGAERNAVEVAEAVVRQGGIVHAVVPLPDDGLAAELRSVASAVDLVPPMPWWMPALRPGLVPDEWATTPLVPESLRDALTRADADVIVSKTAVSPQGAAAAALLGRPHVWMLQEFGDRDHDLLLPGSIDEIGRVVADLSVRVTAISEAVRDHYFASGGEVDILHAAPALPSFAVDGAPGVPRPWTVGILASLHEGKGQGDAVQAIAALRRRGLDVRLALYGRGSSDDRKRLRALASAEGVADLVDLRGVESPGPALAAVDVVAVTSRNEAFGRVPFEAAAAGVPIVYADAGGLRETMADGRSGLAYPAGDVAALADRLASIHEDAALRQRLVSGAQQLLLDPALARRFDERVFTVLREASQEPPTVGALLLGAALGDKTTAARDAEELLRVRDELEQRIVAHELLRADAAELSDALAQRTAAHEALLTEHWELNALREQLASERSVLATENTALRASLDEANGMAERLQSEVRRLAELERSRAFRAVGFARRVVGRLAPGGTHRRGVYERSLRLAATLARRTRPRPPVPSRHVPEVPIALPVYDAAPVVTVVIPIYGKWEYTERCLRSVAAAAGEMPFEVVVVDDASPDASLERLRAVEGITVVAMPENVGFTRAANAGIGAARGEHVVMLNNDTEVTPGWLEALVDCSQDPRAGVVGAKLLFPDGLLQEAGGIVFEDGDGWNYGRSEDPEDPRYNFRKRVDYCSGAALLITRRLLDIVGGFDERYAPAYYEDTDLAFEARRHGFEAFYEPHSVVIHHEGVSHGTDESVGIKAHQVINREKFRQKWAAELAQQFSHDKATLETVATPAVRRGRGTVVIVDHMVPLWREDSGSLRMQRVITNLIDLGYDVVFFPDNRYAVQPYTAELQRLGVLVWYGHGDILRYLKQISEVIEFVIIARQPVAAAHLYNFRVGLPGVPIVFDTVDLHFLREERGAALGLGSVEGAAVTKQLELAVMRSTDATLVVSEVERELLARIAPDVDTFVVSNVHDADVTSPLDERREITFVGSFQHPPNADAITWFTREVLPLVNDALGPVPVSIVGRNPPPIIAGKGVMLHGWVEDLEPIHARSRVAIAPLLYGAGVKGKVGDAWAHGVPAVMTSVAAEGMYVENGVTGFVADDAEGFAAGIIALFRDDEEWTRMSATVRAHVAQHFGSGRLRAAIEELVAHLEAGRS